VVTMAFFLCKFVVDLLERSNLGSDYERNACKLLANSPPPSIRKATSDRINVLLASLVFLL